MVRRVNKKSEGGLNLVKEICKILLEKKAQDITILNVKKISSYTDYIIISSTRSVRHSQGLAENIEDNLYKQGYPLQGIEGEKEGNWILMDYGDVILHIFFAPIRKVYDLEGLWLEASAISLKDLGLEMPREDF